MRRQEPASEEASGVVAEPSAPGPAFSSAALHAPVSAFMERHVACVRQERGTEALHAFFLESGVHGAPVIDERSVLVGYVSLADLVADRDRRRDTEQVSMRVGLPEGGAYYLGPGFHTQPEPRRVADIMSSPPISLEESAPMTGAAALMAFEGVHQLPIVGADCCVVGLLSAVDVLRWLAKQDGYLLPEYSQRGRPRS
jgi:CBS-domain-containing membrane protein